MTPDGRVFDHCPACGVTAQRSELLFGATLFGEPCDIRRCGECGLVYKEWFPAARSLDAIYSVAYVHFDAGATLGAAEVNSAKQKLGRCRRLLPDLVPPEKIRLLDVGCGSGGFVRIARALGYDAHGIDPYLPDDLERTPGLRRAYPDDLPASTYDVAVLLNVAEHVPEPLPLFASVRRLLKPHGAMLVTCPFGDSLARRFHKARWTHLALDEHLLFWTPRSLRTAVRRAGFEGPESVRIAGSPFPFGRSAASAAAAPRSDAAPVPTPSGETFQSRVWRIARRLQQNATAAHTIRHLVHITRTGDYLEYAVSSGCGQRPVA